MPFLWYNSFVMNKNELLSSKIIRDALKDEYKKTNIKLFDSIDSTNLEAKRLKNVPCPFMILADTQTDGRGRLGRSFYSPASTGLYMSIVQDSKDIPDNPVTLTCMSAVAVSRATENLTGKKTAIKWVNDIYLSDKKVCGILASGVFNENNTRLERVITGIGVNISTLSFPEGIDAASLNADVSRNVLAANITNEFFDICGGKKEWVSYYRAHALLTGKRIKYIFDGNTHYGTAGDIDENGALTVTDETGEVLSLFTGEVTVRIR